MPAKLSPLIARLRAGLRDPLYRGSLILLLNTALVSALGFTFWAVAARDYPPATVGSFSGLTAGIGLVATVASLGLPNVITRHLASSDSARGLLTIVTLAITALGGVLCLVVLLGLGPILPASLNLQTQGWHTALLVFLVILTSLNGAWSAGLVALRLSQWVLWTNLAGAVLKLALLFMLTSMKTSGLIAAFSLGLLVSTCSGLPPLIAKLSRGKGMAGSFAVFRGYASVTVNNYAATILGSLPAAVVPLEVIARRGSAEAAPFAVAMMLTAFLTVIPSTLSQVVFAESARQGASLFAQVRKAVRGIYGLLIPLVAVAVVGAPLLMRIFGDAYSASGTTAFRVLAVGTLFMAGNYLVDNMLIARDRGGSYLFMNGVNAVLVLALVGIMLKRGINGAAEGYALAQAVSLVLGLIVVKGAQLDSVAGTASVASASAVSAQPVAGARPGSEQAVKPFDRSFLRSLSVTVPLMLGNLTNTDSLLLPGLPSTLARRPLPILPRQRVGRPGEVVYFGLWYPLMSVPVGRGQVRKPRELPVLIALSGYSGLLTALLIPSLGSPDVLAGTWELLKRLGGVPQRTVWDRNLARAEVADFCASLNTEADAHDESGVSILRQVYAYLDAEFFTREKVFSAQQFNEQLLAWLAAYNRLPGTPPAAPPTVLAASDRRELAPLPAARPPGATWRVTARVSGKPFVPFDSNDYAVDPAALGKEVAIVADLFRVEVFLGAKPIADFRRSWTRGAEIAPYDGISVKDMPSSRRDDLIDWWPERDVDYR